MGPKKANKKYIDQKGSRSVRPLRHYSKRKRTPPSNTRFSEHESASTSNSVKKFKSTDNFDVEVNASFGYRIINFITVFSAISEVLKCKNCDGNVTFSEASCRGLGFKLLIKCDTCEPVGVLSSPLIDGKAYDINRRIIFVFRLLGLGFAALQTFCGFMDLPKAFTQMLFDSISVNIFQATEAVGTKSMENAVKEEVKLNNVNTDLTVIGSCTKQIGGISSLIGYYSGKIVDIIGKSFSEHFSTSIVEMFQRSEEKYSVRYVNYADNGDSETQKIIIDSQPYENVTVKKLERCDRQFSLNDDETLNSVIRSITPETKFCDKQTVDFVIYTAAGIFNDGFKNVLLMMQLMHLTIGPSSHALYLELDQKRKTKTCKRLGGKKSQESFLMDGISHF